MSTNYTTGSFNLATLLLRLGCGGLIIHHGYDKLVHFSTYKTQFMPFLGLSPAATLGLVIFAELICGALLLIGLFSRLACIPLIITMLVALFKAHGGQVFGDGEMATLYLAGYLALLIMGPGKISVDGMAGK